MNYAELSNEIENETPKHAQTNYQYGVIRYLLLIKTARKNEKISTYRLY